MTTSIGLIVLLVANLIAMAIVGAMIKFKPIPYEKMVTFWLKLRVWTHRHLKKAKKYHWLDPLKGHGRKIFWAFCSSVILVACVYFLQQITSTMGIDPGGVTLSGLAKIAVGIIVILSALGAGIVFAIRYVRAKPLPVAGKQTANTPPASTQTTPVATKPSWLKTNRNKITGWVSGIVVTLLVVVFAGQTIWSGTSNVINQVTSVTGVTEFLLVLGFVGMIATLLSKPIREDRRWTISYAIVLGVWVISWAHIKSINYQHGISFTEHLRMPGLIAVWFLIPLCAVALYLVKHWWIRILVLIPAFFVLCGLVSKDFRSSPKTAQIAVLRGAPPSAKVVPFNVENARWEWVHIYPDGFRNESQYSQPSSRILTNDVAIYRNDAEAMSMVEKLPDGRYRYYEWIKNERYGNWREESPLQKGRWRLERRDKRRHHYYDGVIVFDGIGRSLSSRLDPR